MKKIFIFFVFFYATVFAAENSVSSVVTAPVALDSTVQIADTIAQANQDSEQELKAELASRDSALAIRDSVCSVEKDSLRNALELEKAKCANWEKSYETMKKGNETCAQALSVSLGVNEKTKEEKQQMSMMSSASFLGGLGLGMLLFWLIFD